MLVYDATILKNVYSPVHISIHYDGFISPIRFRVCYLHDFKNRFDLDTENFENLSIIITENYFLSFPEEY
jgi:predicted transposase YdaD